MCNLAAVIDGCPRGSVYGHAAGYQCKGGVCSIDLQCSGARARLCVLGFQDPDLTEVRRDSRTLSTASEALIMQWVASHKYRLISGDIKTAFLSGDEDVRNIFLHHQMM